MTGTGRDALLLLLADGRLPAGGHAHSGGIEPAVAAGLVAGHDDLAAYLEGRLATTGRADAAVAVATWCRAGADPVDIIGLRAVHAEAVARIPSPAQRVAARAQGRGLVRVVRRCWPRTPVLDALALLHPQGPLAPMVFGAAGRVGALGAADVATLTLWSTVSGPAWAAVRLLGLDPLEVTRILAGCTAAIDIEAGTAAATWAAAGRPLASMPAPGAPLSEIGAETHAAWEVRLFAS